MNYEKFMEVVGIDQAILAVAHMEKIMDRIGNLSSGRSFPGAYDDERLAILHMKEIHIDLDVKGVETNEYRWAIAIVALDSLLSHYRNHRPSPKMVREGRPVGQWTPPKLPMDLEIPSDSSTPEIDPLEFYQPPLLVDPDRFEWCWLGELWAAEDLWWEYSKSCYRLNNRELFNQQGFEYIFRTEEELLWALARTYRESLGKRLSVSMYFRADHTKSDWETVDRLLEEMYSESS